MVEKGEVNRRKVSVESKGRGKGGGRGGRDGVRRVCKAKEEERIGKRRRKK